MLTPNAGRWILCTCAVALSASWASASPDALSIVQKANAQIKNAKTYQATIVSTNKLGKMGSISVSIHVAAIPAEGKSAIRSAPVGKPTGAMGMQAAMASAVMVDDGKEAYVYSPMMGGYRKSPHRPGSPGNLALLNLERSKGLTFKLVGTRAVEGRPAYVIEVIPPQKQPGSTTLIYVDKATGRYRRIESHRTASAGPGGAPQTVDTILTVTHEVLNAPIPETTFHFTPPAGAKEIPASPAPGGAPGAPGAPQPPR